MSEAQEASKAFPFGTFLCFLELPLKHLQSILSSQAACTPPERIKMPSPVIPTEPVTLRLPEDGVSIEDWLKHVEAC